MFTLTGHAALVEVGRHRAPLLNVDALRLKISRPRETVGHACYVRIGHVLVIRTF
jgi:hypothetical protein